MAVLADPLTDVQSRSLWLAAAAAIGSYVAARLLVVAMVEPSTTNDTPGYVDVDLLGGAQRPWVYPAVRRLFDDATLVYVQALVSAVAFVVLAVAIASTLRTWQARAFVLALVPLLGMTQRITTWDATISTESIAVASTALGIAAAVWWRAGPTWVLVILFVAWTFVRDAHLMLATPIALVVGVIAWHGGRRSLAVAFAVVAVWALTAAQNDRWVESYNVTANIAARVLDPRDGGVDERVDWLLDHGMPDSAALDDPEWISSLRGLQADPAFQTWAEGDGMAVYVRYLAAHPGVLLRALPAVVVDYELGNESMVDQTRSPYASTLVRPFNLMWPNEGSLFTMGLAVSALIAAASMSRRGVAITLPVVLFASTIPHAFLVYHGAPMELARHAVVLAFVLAVSCWWLVLLAVDATMRSRSRSGSSPTP